MISDADLPELSFFRTAETRSRFEVSALYHDLVTAAANDRSPVHRWFRFKESFSADLLRVVLDDLKPKRKVIHLLDPFCGVGTSLVASQELCSSDYAITATGIEHNRSLHLSLGRK